MPSSRPPTSGTDDVADDVELIPPQPRFTLHSDEDIIRSANHSRTTSNAQSVDISPPISPHSVAFSIPVNNPFSPPASIRSIPMSETPFSTPGGTPGPSSPFPATPKTGGSGELPRTSSFYAIPRTTSFSGSRPGTADYSVTSFGRSPRQRDTFSSPPSRPVTIYSSPSTLKLQKERPKSTMLVDSDALQKPWLRKHDTASRVAYFLTYGVMMLGVAAAALRCYFDWQAVPVIKGNLCPVLHEEFDSDEAVFGDNGVFFREVDMSGFGCVFLSV